MPCEGCPHNRRRWENGPRTNDVEDGMDSTAVLANVYQLTHLLGSIAEIGPGTIM